MIDATLIERTAVVCLDCGAVRPAMVLAHDLRRVAEQYVAEHLTTTEHRVVTVPGWPLYRDAVAYARAHVMATRSARPDDVLCDYPTPGGPCALKAAHLGLCDSEGRA
jgi:hypothetical protein